MNSPEQNDVRTDRRIFYPVAIVGGIFCFTIFLTTASLFGDQDIPLKRWINQHATNLILFETALVVVIAVLAMTLDRWKTLNPCHVPAQTLIPLRLLHQEEILMWIKICGVRNPGTIQAFGEHPPDAIGLNFFEKSKRYVPPDAASEIVRALPASIEPVGVFVNREPAQIHEIVRITGIRTVQLHGDETPELASKLRGVKIVRACRVGPAGLHSVAAELDRYQQLGITLEACLIDPHVPGVYGGTGMLAPWEILRTGWQEDWPPLILAGGLTPDNVSDAVRNVRPWGIDVASGVESSPGQQDPHAISRFVQTAREAGAVPLPPTSLR